MGHVCYWCGGGHQDEDCGRAPISKRDHESELRRLLAWAVGWIEDINSIPGLEIEEREGVPDASIWISAHKAAQWLGQHDGTSVCTDPRFNHLRGK